MATPRPGVNLPLIPLRNDLQFPQPLQRRILPRLPERPRIAHKTVVPRGKFHIFRRHLLR